MTLRAATISDYPLLALLHNATHEPHFHVSSADLARREGAPGDHWRGRVVAVVDELPVGMASYGVQDFDRADRAWLDLAIHPDRLQDHTARSLVDEVIGRARGAGIRSLWMPVREDYVDAWPAPSELGFHEVHRTFGGGFFLSGAREFSKRHASTPQLRPLDRAGGDEVAQARALYATVRTDKVTAAPTITSAPDQLDLEDVIAPASFLAFEDDACIGLCLASPSSLGAWLNVIAVHPDHRRRGIGRSLLAATLAELGEREVPFLNTAGVRRDDAYLGLLRSLGATIEPDWISFERVL